MDIQEMIGKKYGRMTVIRPALNSNAKCLCKCDCGREKYVWKRFLLNGDTKSCGCLRSEVTSQKNRDNATHRETGSRLYRIWRGMKARCSYKKQYEYERYGGRGISVCKEWSDSYEAFRDWAFSNGYSSRLTLDRINSDGNYDPENCRWATYKEQENNKSNNRRIEYNGEIKTISEWSDYFGISRWKAMKKLGII